MRRSSNHLQRILVGALVVVIAACVVEDEYFEFPVERRFVNDMPGPVELGYVVHEDSARVIIPTGDSAVLEGKGWSEGNGAFFDVGWKSYHIGRGTDDHLSFTFSDGRRVVFRELPYCSDSLDNPFWGSGDRQLIFCGYEFEVYKDPDLWVERYRIDSADYARAE